MCKARIEKAATSVQGVIEANWNIKTHILTVKYNPNQTSNNMIQRNIAQVGHDTEKYRAPDEAYNNLPQCCHYDRSLLKPAYNLNNQKK
jgi:cation transport ATPase